MFQVYRDFEKEVLAARSVDVARQLNPQLQNFDQFLAKNKSKVEAAMNPAPAASPRPSSRAEASYRARRGSGIRCYPIAEPLSLSSGRCASFSLIGQATTAHRDHREEAASASCLGFSMLGFTDRTPSSPQAVGSFIRSTLTDPHGKSWIRRPRRDGRPHGRAPDQQGPHRHRLQPHESKAQGLIEQGMKWADSPRAGRGSRPTRPS